MKIGITAKQVEEPVIFSYKVIWAFDKYFVLSASEDKAGLYFPA